MAETPQAVCFTAVWLAEVGSTSTIQPYLLPASP